MNNNEQKTLSSLYYSTLDESFSSFIKMDFPAADKYFKKIVEISNTSKELPNDLRLKFLSGRNLYMHAAGAYGSAISTLYAGNFNEAKEHLLKTIAILNKIGLLDQSLTTLTFFAEELIPLESEYSKIFRANSLILLEDYLKSFLAMLRNKEWARELLDSGRVCKEVNIPANKNLGKKAFIKINNLDFMYAVIARFKCASFLYDAINSKQIDFSIIDGLREKLRNTGLTKSRWREQIDAVEKFAIGFKRLSAHNDSDDLQRIMKKDRVELEAELLENLKLPYRQDNEVSLTINEIKNIKKFLQVIGLPLAKTQIDDLSSRSIEAKFGEVKAEYVAFLSRPSGVGVFIDKYAKTEELIQKKYLQKKEKYDIFIYEQAVYKKVMDEGKTKMISLNPSISFRGLLTLFLKYKNVPLPYVEMYHKAFCETAEYNEHAKLPSDVMNTLKNAVNELKREFEYIKGFSIPRAKNSKYICEGYFNFCLILKKSTNEHYTMLFDKFKVAKSTPEEA